MIQNFVVPTFNLIFHPRFLLTLLQPHRFFLFLKCTKQLLLQRDVYPCLLPRKFFCWEHDLSPHYLPALAQISPQLVLPWTPHIKYTHLSSQSSLFCFIFPHSSYHYLSFLNCVFLSTSIPNGVALPIHITGEEEILLHAVTEYWDRTWHRLLSFLLFQVKYTF